MILSSEVQRKGKAAKNAAAVLANVNSLIKDKALSLIADSLESNEEEILKANEIDLKHLEQSEGYSKAFHDRLMLTPERIKGMADGLREIVDLADPVGEVTKMWRRPNGLQIGQVRVPLGVVAIVYEARPNVTVDAAGLALKSGNAVVLRGSSEAINSNKALVKVIRTSLEEAALPADAAVLIESTERSVVQELMKANDYIDVLIPRGGPSLIRAVIENSTVPVIQTGAGNCHTYVDCQADLKMAEAIAVNAKVQRPGVCNAMETLLVHEDIAAAFLPNVITALVKEGVEVRGCTETQKYHTAVKPASEEDWATEYLDLVLAVKVVKNLEEAIKHINKFGTKHSEAIVTDNYHTAIYFVDNIDAAAVYVNASTRFTDGAEFGLGAELGISTQKIHARGPMGLEALTTQKYIVYGEGQIRQ
ncbi:MAG: glutamate-5-semialdehyde dehydrogenase [Firmicutes bacterium]|nr:glutamate-5-semialdehyde dehydrogenase [Bacillota bacterium]